MAGLQLSAERLDALRAVTIREKAALSAAQDVIGNDLSISDELRRQILALQRQIERSGGENLEKRLEECRKAKAAADARAATGEQTVEIARERYTAALKLQKTCEDHLAGMMEACHG